MVERIGIGQCIFAPSCWYSRSISYNSMSNGDSSEVLIDARSISGSVGRGGVLNPKVECGIGVSQSFSGFCFWAENVFKLRTRREAAILTNASAKLFGCHQLLRMY